MLWKVYTAVFVAFGIFGALSYLGALGQHGTLEWVNLLVFTPAAALALASYAYGKPILTPQVWKALLIVCALLTVATLFVGVPAMWMGVLTVGFAPFAIGLAVALVTTIPALVALTRLATTSPSISR